MLNRSRIKDPDQTSPPTFCVDVGYSDFRSFPGILEGQLHYWMDVQEFGYNPLRMTSNEDSDPLSFHLKVKTFTRPIPLLLLALL